MGVGSGEGGSYRSLIRDMISEVYLCTLISRVCIYKLFTV